MPEKCHKVYKKCKIKYKIYHEIYKKRDKKNKQYLKN